MSAAVRPAAHSAKRLLYAAVLSLAPGIGFASGLMRPNIT